jgi:hypothetical protein
LPGTIVAVSDQYLQIATATKDVVLTKVSKVTGQSATLAALIRGFKISKGHHLASPDGRLLERVSKVVSCCSPHEQFWLHQLETARPASLPFLSLQKETPCTESNPKNYCLITNIDLYLKQKLLIKFEENRGFPYILLTAWLVYLHRHNDKAFTIRLSNSSIRSSIYGLDQFFASHVPLTISLPHEMKFEDALQLVVQQVSLVEEHLSYLHDIVVRYPSLHVDPKPIPISIIIAEQSMSFKPSHDSVLTIAIDENPAQFRLIFSDSLGVDDDNQSKMRTVCEHVKVLLNAVSQDTDQTISQLPIA